MSFDLSPDKIKLPDPPEFMRWRLKPNQFSQFQVTLVLEEATKGLFGKTKWKYVDSVSVAIPDLSNGLPGGKVLDFTAAGQGVLDTYNRKKNIQNITGVYKQNKE